jgi:hypothetical protein
MPRPNFHQRELLKLNRGLRRYLSAAAAILKSGDEASIARLRLELVNHLKEWPVSLRNELLSACDSDSNAPASGVQK